MLVVYFIITMILTKKLVIGGDQCEDFHFQSPFYPGDSCQEIYNNNLVSQDKSGYYWILDGPRKVYCGMSYTGSSCEDIYSRNPETGNRSGYYRINEIQWTYCNMTIVAASLNFTCAGMGGEWRKIANMDISKRDDCPNGWLKNTHSGISFCRVASNNPNTCSSAYFSTNETSYQRVCGRARGYQKGATVGFYGYYHRGQSTIDHSYAEGISITYGNPRQHIWTYAGGLYDGRIDRTWNCPCGGGLAPPPFVGNDYYCESGTNTSFLYSAYYFEDPLWDGFNCLRNTDCCSNHNQPWFFQELNEVTSSDIEARLCTLDDFNTNVILVDQFELYIQ